MQRRRASSRRFERTQEGEEKDDDDDNDDRYCGLNRWIYRIQRGMSGLLEDLSR